MTYDIANLAEFVIAAKAQNTDIATAVGDNPVILDIDTPFSKAARLPELLTMPLPLPHNPDYHSATSAKDEALKD